jgi:hypothetical protein
MSTSIWILDWTEAAQIIATRDAACVEAGSAAAWQETARPIYKNGFISSYRDWRSLQSGNGDIEIKVLGERISCARLLNNSLGWTEEKCWPPEAIAFLEAK